MTPPRVLKRRAWQHCLHHPARTLTARSRLSQGHGPTPHLNARYVLVSAHTPVVRRNSLQIACVEIKEEIGPRPQHKREQHRATSQPHRWIFRRLFHAAPFRVAMTTCRREIQSFKRCNHCARRFSSNRILSLNRSHPADRPSSLLQSPEREGAMAHVANTQTRVHY
jgi:hypothetical protein